MRKNIKLLLILATALIASMSAYSKPAKATLIDSLLNIDPEIAKYFPRWEICEPNLQIQIHYAFKLAGYNPDSLNMNKIEILASPQTKKQNYYDLLIVTCGKAFMKAVDIESYLGKRNADYIRGYARKAEDQGRKYCYQDVPPSTPPSESQAAAIVSFLEPTNSTNAITMSLFEQSLKIGESGFWLKNIVGTDEVGYPFWLAGESKAILKIPLYPNQDIETKKQFPMLLSTHLGYGYKLNSAIDQNDWFPDQKLNADYGGKFIGGLDFNLPQYPFFSMHLNMEIPVRKLEVDRVIGMSDFIFNPIGNRTIGFIDPLDPRANFAVEKTANVLRGTGQFYFSWHTWFDDFNPENYFRVDLGINYTEVMEMAYYYDNIKSKPMLTGYGLSGTETWKNSEAMDWLLVKAEYRNQFVYPFGVSAQISNQILLGKIYFPIPGNWLFLEMKYAKVLRDPRPYENSSVFLISPVLRIAL